MMTVEIVKRMKVKKIDLDKADLASVASQHSQHQLRFRLPVMLTAIGQSVLSPTSCLSSVAMQERFNQ